MVEDDRQRRERLPAAVCDHAVRLGADPAIEHGEARGVVTRLHRGSVTMATLKACRWAVLEGL